MPQTPNQRRASDAVAAWLAKHQKNPAWLVTEAGVDPGTIGDFLNGTRWPKIRTQGHIERAVGWPSGTIRQIGNGGDVPDLDQRSIDDAEVPVGAGVDPELLAELQKASPDAIEAVRAVLRATRAGT